ncbi:MAG: hypothetical protein DWQ01_00875 [Planctomycetota bacterium]|nr:MAG: hypothetical protein DWQ01_00875 [Planctomycetota bacterium]
MHCPLPTSSLSQTTLLLLLTLFVGSSGLSGQSTDRVLRPEPLQWTKFSGNPVLPEGAIGAWDHFKSDPFVMKDGQVYKMWYAANVSGEKTGIGYAESLDGLQWSQSPGHVLEVGPDGAWDDWDVETPTVLKKDGIYHLWYSGRGEPEGTNPLLKPDAAYRIGHAVSTDGVNWIKDPMNPVLSPGFVLLSWDWAGTAEPTVIYENGQFKMWYAGVTVQGGGLFVQIGHATSADGRSWQKYSGNPVLSVPELNGILTPSVLKERPFYELWYTVYNQNTGLPAGPIRQAISLNGIQWFVIPQDALVKGSPPEWDWWAIFGPTVILDGDRYKMWYSGTAIDLQGVHLTIGYAESD